MLVLVLVSFVGLIVQRGFQGAPMHDRQAFWMMAAAAAARFSGTPD
jgi:hypothetical protein